MLIIGCDYHPSFQQIARPCDCDSRISINSVLSGLGRRLPFLHSPLLLRMALLQLLGLLLVPLLDLLPSGLVGLTALHSLVLLILFLLKFLPLFLLLCVHFFLLPLVFPVVVDIASLGGSGTLQRRKVFGMNGRGGPIPAASLCGSTIGRRIVWRACLPGGYDGPVVKRRGFWSRRDRRPAPVSRSMQLGIRPRS